MPTSRRLVLAFAVALPIAALTTTVLTTSAHASEPQIYSDNGIAIDGTDTVAYFTEGKPVEGSAEFTHDWRGATWRFSSAENRDLFAADPVSYAPQYGGYCAYAVSYGSTASTVPEAWKIVDGKLYLNYSNWIQRRWENNIPDHIASANDNWPTILD